MTRLKFLLVAVMAMGIMASQAQKASLYEKEGQRTKVTHYYDDGSVRETGYYLKGKPDGNWTEYRADGSIKTKAFYKEGKKTGTWIVYTEDGASMYELVYAENRLVNSHKWKIEERNLLAGK